MLVPAAFLLAAPGWSQPLPSGAKLAEEKQCTQCHSTDKDTIGPSFRKIAAVYGTMPNRETKLIEMMRLGSDAHLGALWTRARMPDTSERPLINDAEAKQLAHWILSLAP